MAQAGIPQVEYEAVTAAEYAAAPAAVRERLAPAGPAGVRQAGTARLVGRDLARRRRGEQLDARLTTALAHDSVAIVEAAAEGARGRVLGARQRRADRLRAGRDPARRGRAGLVRLRGQVLARGDAAGRSRRGSRPRSATASASSPSRRSSAAAAAGWRASTSSSSATTCCSTSSTRCPASRRPASTGRCSRPAGSRTGAARQARQARIRAPRGVARVPVLNPPSGVGQALDRRSSTRLSSSTRALGNDGAMLEPRWTTWKLSRTQR